MYAVTRYKRIREKSKINSLVTHIYSYIPGRRGKRDGNSQGRLYRGHDRFDGFSDGERAGLPDKGRTQETLTIPGPQIMLWDTLASFYHCPNTKGDYYAKDKLQNKKGGYHASFVHFILFCFFTQDNHTCTYTQDT